MIQLPGEKLTLFQGSHFNYLLIIQAVRQFDKSEITGPGIIVLHVWEAALAA